MATHLSDVCGCLAMTYTCVCVCCEQTWITGNQIIQAVQNCHIIVVSDQAELEKSGLKCTTCWQQIVNMKYTVTAFWCKFLLFNRKCTEFCNVLTGFLFSYVFISFFTALWAPSENIVLRSTVRRRLEAVTPVFLNSKRLCAVAWEPAYDLLLHREARGYLCVKLVHVERAKIKNKVY